MSCAAHKCTYRVVRKGLCAAHASKAEHPGRVLYLGRWRTPEEAAVRIISDQSMRGVKWAIESGVLIGRQNGFEMRLPYCDPHSVLLTTTKRGHHNDDPSEF